MERPLECSDCKRALHVQYCEIIGDNITRHSMCAECPVLQRLLHGTPTHTPIVDAADATAGLCCGHCGVTLESIRTGSHLGCSECYEVFGDVLAQDMLTALKIPQRIAAKASKSMPLHHGRSPKENTEVNPSMHLLALNEALTETLSREDYEQAAWLRDQIKALTERGDDTKQ